MQMISFIVKLPFVLLIVAAQVLFLPGCVTPLRMTIQPPTLTLEAPAQDVNGLR